MLAAARPLQSDRLERPTLVLAPHPDDETLGCGGLIALLRERGTPVHIVFMTDGAGSHPSLEPNELVETRRREAISATTALGVDEADLHFLNHADGRLANDEELATRELVGLISDLHPAQIVAPHPFEPHPDHSATFRVVDRAARERGLAVDGLLFAVWFWDQWPFTNPLSSPHGRHTRRAMLETARRGRLGFGVGRRFTHVVDIGEVIDRKRAALAAHASQTSRPADRPDWVVLDDVANGDWLDLLTQSHELYSLTRLGAF